MKTLIHILFFLLSCGAFAASPSSAIITHQRWGNLDQVTQYGQFYFSAAPDENALAEFKKRGGQAVVDLRTTKEMDCSELAVATKLGLKYQNIQFKKAEPINKAVIAQIEKAVADSKGASILLHCETGNRAAAWLAIHLVTQDKMKPKEALSIAEEVGLRSADLKTKVGTYLK
ncbi:MAG: sulfur transferase domain-containing protein [Bdellovibrionales bacterium]